MCLSPATKLPRQAFWACLCALAIAAFFAAPAARAAKLTLDNGDQISGEILGLQKQFLTLKSPLFGRVRIHWNRVIELQSDAGIRIELANGQQLQGQLLLKPDGRVVVTPTQPSPEVHMMRSDLARLNPPVIDPSVQYSGRATLGGTFNRGNSNDEMLNLDAELVARTPDKRYVINLAFNEARTAGFTTSSGRLMTAQHDIFLSQKNYVFVNARVQSDVLADLTLRTSLGTGYGRQIVEDDQTKLSTEAGLNYVIENYEIAPDRSYPALSLALKFEQKFFDNSMVFFNNAHLTGGRHESTSTLVTNKLGIRVPIADGLNLTTQFNMAYDSSPPAGIKPTDSSLIFGVGYVY
jgi:putative salt-induced outer membrane protein YdiY